MLAIFSNIDKHRRLTTTVLRPHVREIVTSDLGRVVAIGVPLDDGAEVFPLVDDPTIMQGKVDVVREAYPKIAFDEPEFGQREPSSLDDITHHLPFIVLNIVQQFRNLI